MNWDLVLHYAFVACCVAGAFTSALANFKLLPDQRNSLRVFFWRSKDEFTAQGWRLRQISLLFCYLAVGIAIFQWIAQ